MSEENAHVQIDWLVGVKVPVTGQVKPKAGVYHVSRMSEEGSVFEQIEGGRSINLHSKIMTFTYVAATGEVYLVETTSGCMITVAMTLGKAKKEFQRQLKRHGLGGFLRQIKLYTTLNGRAPNPL